VASTVLLTATLLVTALSTTPASADDDTPFYTTGCVAGFARGDAPNPQDIKVRAGLANPDTYPCRSSTFSTGEMLLQAQFAPNAGCIPMGFGCLPGLPTLITVSAENVSASTHVETTIGTFHRSRIAQAESTVGALRIRVGGALVAEVIDMKSSAASVEDNEDPACVTYDGYLPIFPGSAPVRTTTSVGRMSLLGIPLGGGSTPTAVAIPGVPGARIVTNYIKTLRLPLGIGSLAAAVRIEIPGQQPVNFGVSGTSLICNNVVG
jgi:hypothetical protein